MRDTEVIQFEEKTRLRALGQVVIAVLIFLSPIVIAWGHDLFRTLDEDVFILGKTVQGMNRWQVEDFLEEKLGALSDAEIVLESHSGGRGRFSYQDLGVHYAIPETVAYVFDVTSWWYNFSNVQASSGDEINFKPIVFVDDIKLESIVDQYLSAQQRLPKDASLAWEDLTWNISPEQSGWAVEENELERISDHIQDIAYSYDKPPALKVRFNQPQPGRTTQDIQGLYELLLATIEKPIDLHYQDDHLQVTINNSDQWIKIQYDEGLVELNEPFVKNWIAVFALQYDSKSPDVVVKGIENIVSEYDGETYQKAVLAGDFSKGRKMDQENLFQQIKSRVLTSSDTRKIDVEYETLTPKIISEVEGLEFPQQLSMGQTSYAMGSYTEREENIRKSLEIFTGVIIPQGEEFSFNRVSGWITQAKGYYKTKVIIGGEVKEGVGGGVCQSSTTMYRSVINAGMPLTEHKHHSLDVVYYHKYGYGLDATVYQETRQDLRFVNDTPGPILIFASMMPGFETVMEFYGTTDGRRVEMTPMKAINNLHKKWSWKIIKGDEVEERIINTVYQPEKKPEEIVIPTEI
ncbi:MAG: VanW family protein [Candidatus Gracilibacteria bacterium]|nr:VanW family protein [Candidatus Gracilibacteria bacterium]